MLKVMPLKHLKRERSLPDNKEHYNELKKHRTGRSTLVRYNNAIKSMLIDIFCKRKTVLDLCAGKGGDLAKFRQAKVTDVALIDHAEQSIQEAEQRFREMKWKVPHSFQVHDCHVLIPHLVSGWEVVTCQFAMHYAFASEATARSFFQNVSQALKPGGHFIATFPDPQKFTQKKFENSICRYEFDNEPADQFGSRYMFFLQDCVLNVPEYRVPTALLLQLASEYKLKLVSQRNFEALERSWEELPLWKQLTQGGSLSVDERQVFLLYQAIVFQRIL